MIDVAVIGYGLAGRTFHAPFITAADGLRLAAILRRSGEPDPKYPGVQFVRTLDEILSRDDIRLVVVATPNDSHVPIARECLLAGRDVVVDKPLAPTLREAQELVQLAQSRGRLLTVFQNRRWDGDFMTVQEIIRSGVLGRVVLYESHFDRFRPKVRATWREKPVTGMGLLHNLGPHLVDQALLLFGKPDYVSAELRKEREGTQVFDAFDLNLQYPHMRVLLRASEMTAAPGPRFWICGSTATFTKHGLDPQESDIATGGNPNQTGWGAEPEERWGTITTETETRKVQTIAGNYRAYYENVRDAILGAARIAVTPEHALDVTRAIELSIESNRSGCRMPWQ